MNQGGGSRYFPIFESAVRMVVSGARRVGSSLGGKLTLLDEYEKGSGAIGVEVCCLRSSEKEGEGVIKFRGPSQECQVSFELRCPKKN